VQLLWLAEEEYSCASFLMEIFCRELVAKQSNEGRSASPFRNSDPQYLQQAKPNLQNFSRYPLHHMLHSQQAIPNHLVPELSPLPTSSTWCYGSRPNHANRWIPAGLSFSIFLHWLEFEPILPLPHLGLATDPSHPRGPLLKNILLFFSNLLSSCKKWA
jgi:hypothetical protein